MHTQAGCGEKTKFLDFSKWCSTVHIYHQMWGKRHWNQVWDGALSSDRAHLSNARKIANLAYLQNPLSYKPGF